MTRYSTYFAGVWLILFCVFSGCKKDKDKPVTTGSISGIINPKAAAIEVKATAIDSFLNKSYSALVDTTTGAFEIKDVDSGAYSISFINYPNFLEHANVNIRVPAGENKDMGTLDFQSGSITGTVSPIGSVSFVSVFSAVDGSSYAVAFDTATGVFKTGVLPAGRYYVSFAASYGYALPSPAPLSVTAVSGQTTDVGTFVMVPHLLSGAPFSTPSFFASYSSPQLTITTDKHSIGDETKKTFKIVMDDITAPGTYACKNTATSNITYTSTVPIVVGTWSTQNAGGSGTVVVTSIDEAKKEIKGTFKATLTNAGNSLQPTFVIDNGVFDFIYK